MKLIAKGSKFICETTYAEREIPKAAGCRWDGEKRCWYTTKPEIAEKLIRYADPATKALLANLSSAHQAAAAAQVDKQVEVVAPEGLKYLPYQVTGIEFAAARPATLIADEMGLGKTVSAIGAINSKPSVKKVLVVCPASLCLNWRRELRKWLTRNLSVEVAGKDLPETDVVIITYGSLRRFRAALIERRFDLLILDEAHYAKSQKAQRSQLVAELASCTSQKILLTGTPIVNRPAELWHLLHILDPTRWDSFFTYGKRYCDAYETNFGWDFSGASNMEELQQILRETVMIRRLKKDVLTELPPKRRQIIELQADGMGGALFAEAAGQAEIQALKARIQEVREWKSELTEVEYKKAVKALKVQLDAAFGELSRVRHETALAKGPQVVEHCRELLENTEKLVVFGHHRDVIEAIRKGLSDFNPVTLTGETSQQDRQAAVDAFQEDPATRVFIGSITAAGVGITLTAADTVVFAELDWVPGNITQAEDRLHRLGQHNSVLVQHLVLEGSIDAVIAKTVVSKQEVIDTALDRKEEVSEEELLEIEAAA